MWELTGSLSAATLAGMLLTFDTGFTVINRYILLDPIMIFFISVSFYTMVRFRKLANQSFSRAWWRSKPPSALLLLEPPPFSGGWWPLV